MAIETPVQVLQRLREQQRQERLAQSKAGTEAIQRARTPSEKGFNIGQAIGGAFAQGFQQERAGPLEESEVYKQAQARRALLAVDPLDTKGLRNNIKIAADQGDYEVSNYLTDRLLEAEKLRLMQEQVDVSRLGAEAKGGGKDAKWEDWDKDLRNRFTSQIKNLDWVKDINNEDEEAAVGDAVVARAESIWNALQKKGMDVSQDRVMDIATKMAQKHFHKGLTDDTFDFGGFSADAGPFSALGLGETSAPVKGTKPQPPAVGTIVGNKRFIGGDASDPSRWKVVKKEEEEVEALPEGAKRGKRGGGAGTTKLTDIKVPTGQAVGRKRRN